MHGVDQWVYILIFRINKCGFGSERRTRERRVKDHTFGLGRGGRNHHGVDVWHGGPATW
jgi:hypothetical protein